MRNYRLSNRETSGLNSSMPLVGPATYEEAIERIENGIQEMEHGEGYLWEDVKADILLSEEAYAG